MLEVVLVKFVVLRLNLFSLLCQQESHSISSQLDINDNYNNYKRGPRLHRSQRLIQNRDVIYTNNNNNNILFVLDAMRIVFLKSSEGTTGSPPHTHTHTQREHSGSPAASLRRYRSFCSKVS